MPIEKEKPLPLAPLRDLAKQVESISYDEGQQDADWKYTIAGDLNCILANAYDGLMAREFSSVSFAEAALRIVKRVEEFEGIRRAK
jgi:hypothetical protein